MLLLVPLLFTADSVPVHNAAPIDRTVPPVVVPVDTPASHDGQPIEISDGVTLTMTDGFTVTMSQEDADFALEPPTETEAQYLARLCRQLQEVKPWLEIPCEDF